MTRALLLVFLLLVSSLLTAPGAVPVSAAEPAKPAETTIVCEFGGERVVLRLHSEGELAKAESRWTEFCKKFFDYLDRDGDGVLNAEEFRRAPSPEQVRAQWAAGLYPRIGQAGADLKAADIDGNGKVSREEMEQYYRKGMTGPLTITELAPDARTERLTAVMFALLDTDRDGKLSRKELEAAEQAFRRADADENEILTPDELLAAVPDVTLLQKPTPVAVRPSSGEKNREKQADLEVSVDLVGGCRQVGKLPREWVSFAPDKSAPVSFASSRFRLHVAVNKPNTDWETGVRPFFRQQFETADRGKRGWVEKRDLTGKFLAPLHTVFDLADRDGNGRLTEDELLRCIDLHARWAAVPLSLSVQANRAGLFELLDTDNDGRLSPRELRNAVKRLAVYDRDGDGSISAAELPASVAIGVSVGPPSLKPVRPSPALRPVAPLWFTLLDTNGDGDISPSEFHGTLEEFRRLDTDGDGLISIEEAVAAAKATPKP